jgi:hypothetical protein
MPSLGPIIQIFLMVNLNSVFVTANQFYPCLIFVGKMVAYLSGLYTIDQGIYIPVLFVVPRKAF